MNGNNCDGQKVALISIDACYKPSDYFYIRNKNRRLSTQYFVLTGLSKGENYIMRSFVNCTLHGVTLEW
jgi:hypothetical protein